MIILVRKKILVIFDNFGNECYKHSTSKCEHIEAIIPIPPDCFAGFKAGKGKSVPLQAWSGPEGSRKLRFPDFMTTAQDGGKFVSLTHRPPLPPRNAPGTHFC